MKIQERKGIAMKRFMLISFLVVSSATTLYSKIDVGTALAKSVKSMLDSNDFRDDLATFVSKYISQLVHNTEALTDSTELSDLLQELFALQMEDVQQKSMKYDEERSAIFQKFRKEQQNAMLANADESVIEALGLQKKIELENLDASSEFQAVKKFKKLQSRLERIILAAGMGLIAEFDTPEKMTKYFAKLVEELDDKIEAALNK